MRSFSKFTILVLLLLCNNWANAQTIPPVGSIWCYKIGCDENAYPYFITGCNKIRLEATKDTFIQGVSTRKLECRKNGIKDRAGDIFLYANGNKLFYSHHNTDFALFFDFNKRKGDSIELEILPNTIHSRNWSALKKYRVLIDSAFYKNYGSTSLKTIRTKILSNPVDPSNPLKEDTNYTSWMKAGDFIDRIFSTVSILGVTSGPVIPENSPDELNSYEDDFVSYAPNGKICTITALEDVMKTKIEMSIRTEGSMLLIENNTAIGNIQVSDVLGRLLFTSVVPSTHFSMSVPTNCFVFVRTKHSYKRVYVPQN